jgi:uncharacterized protein YbaR (Trm112 family)
MAVSPDLLEILRCPYCVSGPTRKPGHDPGRLELVRDSWLVCQEPDCERKYPIKEDIPVMLIDEGDKWANTAIEDLPEPGSLVDSSFSIPAGPMLEAGTDRQFWLGLALGLIGMILIALFFTWLFRQRH